MQLRKKTYLIKDIRGDRHGETIQDTPVSFSNADAIIQKLSTYLREGNDKAFKEALNADFICEGPLDNFQREYSHGSEYWIWQYQKYAVCPVVEYLFFNKSEQFRKLFCDENNEMWVYTALIQSLENTSLTKEKLFTLNDDTLTNLTQKKDALYQYRHSTSTDKQTAIEQLQPQLSNLLESEAPALIRNINQPSVWRSHLHILDFKLRFKETLHSKDEVFKDHRGAYDLGWKRLLTNFSTILFPPLAFANLIYRAATGSWLFANQTETQIKVADAEAALWPGLK